jgi:hypothetical protein
MTSAKRARRAATKGEVELLDCFAALSSERRLQIMQKGLVSAAIARRSSVL